MDRCVKSSKMMCEVEQNDVFSRAKYVMSSGTSVIAPVGHVIKTDSRVERVV